MSFSWYCWIWWITVWYGIFPEYIYTITVISYNCVYGQWFIPKLELSMFPFPCVKTAFWVSREYCGSLFHSLLPAVHQHSGSRWLLLMSLVGEDRTRSCMGGWVWCGRSYQTLLLSKDTTLVIILWLVTLCHVVSPVCYLVYLNSLAYARDWEQCSMSRRKLQQK